MGLDNATKDPNFINGFYTPQGEDLEIDEKFLSPTKFGEPAETASKQLGSTDAGTVATAGGDDEKTVANEVSKGDINVSINNS